MARWRSRQNRKLFLHGPLAINRLESNLKLGGVIQPENDENLETNSTSITPALASFIEMDQQFKPPLTPPRTMPRNLTSRLRRTIAFALIWSFCGWPGQAQDIVKDTLDQLVADWAQTATEQLNAGSKIFNTAHHGPVEYVKNGSGPVVLCMHGGPGGYDQSALIGEHLIANGFTVIGVSRSGYLRTPLIPGTNDTAVLQAGAMIELLDGLGINQAAVLGFSAGSIVGFQMALNYPDRISALVMEGIGSQASDANFYAFLQGLLQDSASLDPLSYIAYLSLYITENITMSSFLSLDTDLKGEPLQQRVEYVAINQKPFYFRFYNTLLPLSLRRDGLNNDINGVDPWADYESRGELGKIKVPTIIIQSRNDTSGNYAQSLQIANRIPGAQVVPLDATGHFCWLGPNTAAWQAQLASFLRQAAGPRLTLTLNFPENKVTLSWKPAGGRLQSALKATGPWTDLNVMTPATLPFWSAENRFFQVVNP